MELIFKIFLGLHIAAGTTALLAGPIAMVTQKGRSNHRISGKIYVWAMGVVFLTAIYMSIAKSNTFLLLIGFFSFYLVVSAHRVLYVKKGIYSLIDYLLHGGALLFSLVFILLGVNLYFVQDQSFGILSIVFGSIGSLGSLKKIKLFFSPPQDKNNWLYDHISGMLGGYIATATAVLVVNNHFLPDIVAWLLPTAIGSPAIFLWVKYYKDKFNKGGEPKEVVAIQI